MAGIASYGAYVPPTRLALAALSGGAVEPGGPEKAVAWDDEDSVTMAVAAGIECLRGLDRGGVDAVFFASTTYPYREKQGASLIAKALDLDSRVRTVDYGGSLRAGTNALRGALDAVDARSARAVLVLASDCRMGAPGSSLDRSFGDAAAAFLVTASGEVASFERSYALSDEIVDVWRGDGDRFVHSWEERFVVQEGYARRLAEAVQGLLRCLDCDATAFTRFALYGPDARSHANVVRSLHLEPARVQDPLFGRVGNAGTAFAPLLLAASLEQARPGDRLLVASYGDGAEAMGFRATDRIEKLEPRRGVTWHLTRRRPLASQHPYLQARGLAPEEYPAATDPGLSATVHFREREEELSFRGQQCRSCRAIQFPLQRVCANCFAKDEFDGVRLSDRRGKVVTYTLDYFFPTPHPPTIVTVTEVDGGARVHLQLVDARPEDVRIDLPVEFVFRKIHAAGGRPNYYWKARPL